ncbi:hypothetical protein ACFL1X_02410 [Candidatus Hydrogenedentota bacterium]
MATGSAVVTATSGPVTTYTTSSAGVLASGWGSASGVHMATGAAVAKAAVIGGIFGTLVYTSIAVAVGYATYCAYKGLINLGTQESAEA